MQIQNKVIVITGASSGIGAEMAVQIAAKGGIPVLIGRAEHKLNEVAAGISGKHGVYVMDVRDDAAAQETMKQIIVQYGRIDILINNAGFGVFTSFLESPIEEFEAMMDVNYMGIVRCTKAVLPQMIARGSGHVVNIASIAGKIGTAKSTGYSASKHAVLGLTNALRQELAGSGVKVTAINPGPIATPFFEKADPTGNYVKNISNYMLKPEKVAQVVLQAIEKEQDERNLPHMFALGAKFAQLFPRTFNRISVKFLNKK
ncbi:SDR family oxidoreductase [Paenibacillus sp. N1-5-1-14]|uniref:SDR family NAD(P)-dependent oxidoreductase n=1 Tax=Paenibacillus radicibacter TaxID=2972488 RepID=UPI002158E237|nr:SDR family oxidoreductase [Paenibacillus radicibacter]MCR8645228.1 SDR family oxidoreductase [Paenibacillus radicibacter]